MSNSSRSRPMEGQLLADASTRQRALEPQQSFIVQAPAGSGKTELLTQRYLQLLTTVEQPEQILAITFTRKAASEMRNRILQSLQRARTTERPDKAHEAQNWDLAQAALQHDARCHWQLEMHPARLRIQTIDSLNASLSRRLPMLAGMGASMEIAQDQWPIYESVCERLLWQLGDGSEDSQHLETVLRHLANRVPDFMQMLCDLLARRDHWLPLLMKRRNDAQLRESIEATLRAVIEHALQDLQRALPAHAHAELIELAAFAASNLLKDGTDTAEELDVLESLAGLTCLPPTDASQLPIWLGLANLLCKKDRGRLKPEFYAKVDKRQGFPTDNKPAKQRMVQLLETLREVSGLSEAFANLSTLPAAHFSDAQWHVLLALLQLLPKAAGELLLEFQDIGQVDYVELSLRALKALGEGAGEDDEVTDLALTLDEKIQHILIDEFQDTSHTQMRLLQKLVAGWSEGDGRTLFCVGDPMQSIYRFRQAEVGLFLNLQRHGLPGVPLIPLQLQTNFRSTQPIVDWVNQRFAHIMPLHDDAERGAVHYSASQPRPDASSQGQVHIHAGIDRSSQQEATEIRTLVQESLITQPDCRVAILVSGRSHVGPIAQELKQHGIAFRAVDIERLQDCSVVQDLIALTRALVHPADRTAWLACLRAPWCGLALADLHTLAAHDQRTIHELISPAIQHSGLDKSSPYNSPVGVRFIEPDLKPVLTPDGQQRLQRFAQVVTAALNERARHSLRDWVECTWLALHGPACLNAANELDDAQSYFARLDELEVAGDLEDLTRLEAQLGTLYANASDQGETRVEIMTIHKSKGLEFDVVILPSLHRTGGRDHARLLRWTHLAELNTDGLVMSPPGAKGDDGDAIYQWLAELEKQRARYESQRLLYVAATRARRELHLFGSVALNKEGDTPTAPRTGSLLALLWPQVSGEFEQAVARYAIAAPSDAAIGTLLLRRLPLSWAPPEPHSPIPGQQGNVINAETPPEFDWVGETARHIGTVVHAELERLVKLSPSAMQQWRSAARKPALLLHLAELGVPEAMRHTAVERVIKAIEHTRADARGRWILGLDAKHQDAGSEIALSGIIHQDVINGIIDRSFVDAGGVRWIIDFKTSSHEGGGRDAFLQSEIERYGNQMQRYARLMSLWKPGQTIKCALYFPLMGEWREVQVAQASVG